MKNYIQITRDDIVRDFRDGELTLGETIRQLRKHHMGCTQRNLAIRSNVAVGTLAAVEQECDRISLSNLNSLIEPMGLELTIDGQAPGTRARKARKTNTGLTQVAFAKLVGVAAGTLAAFEKGQMQISLGNALRILDRLDLELRLDLVEEEAANAPEGTGGVNPEPVIPANQYEQPRVSGGLRLDSRAPSLSDILWPKGRSGVRASA